MPTRRVIFHPSDPRTGSLGTRGSACNRWASVAFLLAFLAAAGSLAAQEAESPRRAATWIERSDAIAKEVLRNYAALNPEQASAWGVEGFDDQITDFSKGFEERQMKMLEGSASQVRKKLAAETEAPVRQDLEIMLRRLDNEAKLLQLRRQYKVPYVNAAQEIFRGVKVLLDDQVKPERRKLALVRLRKYAGVEQGFRPATELIRERMAETLSNPKLLAPSRIQLDKDLQTNALVVQGIGSLLQKYGIRGYEESYAALQKQLAAYDQFLRQQIAPRAREDFREPADLYRLELRELGVDIPQEQLVTLARRAYEEIRAEMQTLAAQIAKERKLPSSDYRDVIHTLKKSQLGNDEILPTYKQRLAQMEEIIRRERLVSLPARPARMRFGTPAENAEQPAPHMVPPRLVGNTGEQWEFVLPLNNPGAMGAKQGEGRMDDFTYDAATWTLTAHELRPGHELQFASLVERGVSLARAIFASNSTNVEGWALYSEWLMYPSMPPDGKLISLQFRLQRAVRAFTDPDLQMGTQTPQQALALMEKEVVLSPPMASQEVERYTFRMPGQATTYFYGYTRLLELRNNVAKVMGKKFDQQKFHDFILAEGLLPPDLLRAAVFEEFVKQPDPGPSGTKLDYAQEAR